MYVVLVNLSIKQEHADKFEQAILKNAAASVRDEKECHRFDVCQGENNPAQWMFYEVYTDRTAFDHHHRQAHFLEYDAVAQELVIEKRVTTFHMRNP